MEQTGRKERGMKVEINGKTYCVETLIADNARLRKDVIANADNIRLVLDQIRAEIDRQEKWLLQAGYTTYNVDIAFDAIKSIIAEMR